MKTIDINEFSEVIGENLTDFASNKISNYVFEYEELSEEENKSCLEKISNSINNPPTISGKHRSKDWENGWNENKEQFIKNKDIKSLIPRYFGKFPYVRWNKKIIKVNKNFEYDMLCSLEYQVFSKWLTECKNIYEFGCGTGHNLLRARECNPSAELFGLDWASSSQQVLNLLTEEGVECKPKKFDFFEPDYDVNIDSDSGVYTVAALEQIGENFKSFVDFLLIKKPKICVNIEPITELFDDSNLEIDKLCKKYCESRNYLKGYLTYLKELEKQNKIKIIESKRNYIGSFFIEGYSTVIWEVL